jgi:hypothetical protein
MVVPLPQSCGPVGPPQVGLPPLISEVIAHIATCPAIWSISPTQLDRGGIGPERRLAMGDLVAVEQASEADYRGRCAFALAPGQQSV